MFWKWLSLSMAIKLEEPITKGQVQKALDLPAKEIHPKAWVNTLADQSAD
jgi:hypothetical protein